MDKKSFILYLDQQELFNKLPDDIAGKLIKHIFSYVNCENPEASDLILDIAFEPIRQALKRDLKAWEKQKIQRSDAGKKSAEARANKKQRNQRALNPVERDSTKSTVSVSGSVSVSVSDSDKTKDIKQLDYSSWPGMPNKQTLKDWLAMRKRLKANVSQTVINNFSKQLKAAVDLGYTVDCCLSECVTRNWRGFKAEWLNNEKTGSNQRTNLTAVERVIKAGEEQERRELENGQIDITAYTEVVGEDGEDIRT